jgi:pimeloyl-ACP methyl ester carboxylesterase
MEFGLAKRILVALLVFLSPLISQAVACNVILVPGAFGTGSSSRFLDPKDYFAEYETYFKEHGCEVLRLQFQENATIESRALTLRDEAARFLKRVKGKSAFIVAHSQGGLDTRFALKTVGLSGITAVVTIGSPHEGTPLAEWVIANRDSKTLLYWALRIFANYDLGYLPFAGEMTTAFLKKFEDKFQAVPTVRFASARGACQSDCHWAFKLLDWVSGIHLLDANGDGIVPAQSQAFGEDLGTYDLDHISEVGADPAKREERKRFLDRCWQFFNSERDNELGS